MSRVQLSKNQSGRNSGISPVENDGFVDRLKHAIWLLGRPPGKSPTQAELAQQVGERLGKRVSQASVAGWFAGAVPRTFDTILALAQVLEVDPGWLYFGEASKAPSPDQVERDSMPAPKATPATRTPVRSLKEKGKGAA